MDLLVEQIEKRRIVMAVFVRLLKIGQLLPVGIPGCIGGKHPADRRSDLTEVAQLPEQTVFPEVVDVAEVLVFQNGLPGINRTNITSPETGCCGAIQGAAVPASERY